MGSEGKTPAPAPERWLVVELQCPPDEWLSGLIVDQLATLSGRGVVEGGGVLTAYFEATPKEVAPLLRTIQDRLDTTSGSAPIELTHRWQEHEEWVSLWRAGFHHRQVTDRLVVSPTWENPKLQEGDLLISIDPGMAFGTGEHATTRGCLLHLDRLVRPGDRVADVGAGSGILSIAAALLGAGEVVAIEPDRWACTAALQNAETNAVGDSVRVLEIAAGPRFVPDLGLFDGIVANIETGVLVPLLAGFRTAIRKGGWLILGGILEVEAEEVVSAAARLGLRSAETCHEEGWWTGGFVS